ncbi:patatin-like phospholipase family protein [Alcaligenaceae bacterium]|nr:patatin-like phospholipase family protein [Alcaligenaceae bacterium]
MSDSSHATAGGQESSEKKGGSVPVVEPSKAPPDAIQMEIAKRRKNLGGEEPLSDKDPIWGIALSGGGIRSATFSFGVLRALAHRKLLLRFDLLSTVSGGGYIGATIGSLFHRAANGDEARAVQDAIDGQFPSPDGGEKSTSWFLWWLRANGRYLIPQGVKDTTFAVALYLRNLVGIHFELGLIAILIGLLLAAVDLGAWWTIEQLGYQFANKDFFAWLRWIPNWLPTIFLLLPFVALCAARLGAAYWAVPWAQVHARGVSVGSTDAANTFPATKIAGKSTAPAKPKVKTPWIILGGVLVTDIALSIIFWKYGTTSTGVGNIVRNALWWTCSVLVALWVTGAYTAQRQLLKARNSASAALQTDEARNVLTKRLAKTLRLMMAIVLVGVVDRVAWFLAFNEGSMVNVGLTLALVVAVLRGLMPLVTSFAAKDGMGASAVLMLGRIGGYVMIFLLTSWWVTLVFHAVLGALFFGRSLDYAGAWLVLGLLAIPIIGYVVFTGRNLTFLNLSSLHYFYRARLVRSYLGAANPSRFGAAGELGAISQARTQMGMDQTVTSIYKVRADDDISLTRYRPQDSGGPIHLINVCVNQTKDPRGGIFNQDRRGLALTVASGGLMRESLNDWTQLSKSSGMSVGRWMAISGAAAAPGMGFRTQGGLAALMTFAGVRLGYWWSKGEREGTHEKVKTNPLSKSMGLLAEVFGKFEGTAGPDWFLTDGGHFENTGAYALLAQRAEVIVVADCGADPHYKFADLENLVRIARVDLHADIQFLRPKPASRQPGQSALHPQYRSPSCLAEPSELVGFFGSINDLASKDGTACLALAKVVYGGERPGKGILILIKPNICEGLPVDLVNFKLQYPDFPQQPTADQFFSEAQWESYFLLGQYLGSTLNCKFIEQVLLNPDEFFEADDRSPFEESNKQAKANSSGLAEAGAAISRLPSRIGQTAVGTTLGLGAAATVAITTWQGIDGVRTSYARKTEAERAALKELTSLWAKVPAPLFARKNPQQASLALSDLAAAIVFSADTLCPSDEAKWFTDSAVATQITSDAIDLCKDSMRKNKGKDASAGSACYMLVEASIPDLQSSLPKCLSWKKRSIESVPPPLYWGLDYSATRTIDYWHPCEPLRAELLAAENVYTDEFGSLLAKRSTEIYKSRSSNEPSSPKECRDGTPNRLNAFDMLRLYLSDRVFTLSKILAPSVTGAGLAPQGHASQAPESSAPSPVLGSAGLAGSTDTGSAAPAAAPPDQNITGVTLKSNSLNELALRFDQSDNFVTTASLKQAAPTTGAGSETPGAITAPQGGTPQIVGGQAHHQVFGSTTPAPLDPNKTESAQKASSNRMSNLPLCVDGKLPTSIPTVEANVVCKGINVFVQTFGPDQQSQLACYQQRWEALLAAKPLPMEDVVETALHQNRIIPAPIRRNEIRYHGSDSELCAMKINEATGNAFVVKPLSARLTPSRRTLEVWVAPSASAKSER